MRKRIRLKAEEVINNIILCCFGVIVAFMSLMTYFLGKSMMLFIGCIFVTIGISLFMFVLIELVQTDKKIR
jgi:protein-S-isoprenylcysteine O-methyltransferase Ste14